MKRIRENAVPLMVIEIGAFKQALRCDTSSFDCCTGAGLAVPTIRQMSEHLLYLCPEAFLIRINPRDVDLPEYFADRSHGIEATAIQAISSLRQSIQ